MSSSIVIFNQYYYDLFTKVRTIAKKHKDNSTTANRVLTSMKEHYKEFDKTSDEYLNYLKEQCNEDFWKSYLELSKEESDDWLKNDHVKDIKIFKEISIGDISILLRDNFLCHHYLSTFYIFKNDMSDDSANTILKILQTFDDKVDFNVEKIFVFISSLKVNNNSIIIRNHPSKANNILSEFAEAMIQPRYQAQRDQTISYITNKIKSGYSLRTENLYWTSAILRNMSHPDTRKINEDWYSNILECGIECQISFDFIAQNYNTIGVMPFEIN
jgi:hypothetical protein